MTTEFDVGLNALTADLTELDQAFQIQFDRIGVNDWGNGIEKV